MRIYRMRASFGCLNRETLNLEDGFNLITAPNESGKSTWCAFLIAMLYGLNSRERDKRGFLAEKNRYRPWNGAPMEGLMECDYEDKRVILRRTTEGNLPMGKFSAIWAESGLLVEGLTGENVGEAITGVSRDLFERSVFFRQNGLFVEQSEALEQRIEALLSTGDEAHSWSQADARLRAWQRQRRHNKSGDLPRLEEEGNALRQKQGQVLALQAEQNAAAQALEDAQNAYAREQRRSEIEKEEARDKVEVQWNAAAEALDKASRHLDAVRNQPAPPKPQNVEEQEAAARARIRARGRNVLLACGVSLLLILGLLILGVQAVLSPLMTAGAIALLLLLTGMVAFLLTQRNQDDRMAIERLRAAWLEWESFSERKEAEVDRAEEKESEARVAYLELSRTLQNIIPAVSQLDEALAVVEQCKQMYDQLCGRLQELGSVAALEVALLENQQQITKLQTEYDALELALGALKRADTALRERFAPALNERVSAYFHRLTDGAYEQILLERDFSAQTEAPGETALRSALQLSQGSLDQLYFALRLAISELLLPEDSTLPFLLDDALASFDDVRAERALTLLLELSKRRQIIFFSCQTREKTMMKHRPGVSLGRLVGAKADE